MDSRKTPKQETPLNSHNFSRPVVFLLLVLLSVVISIGTFAGLTSLAQRWPGAKILSFVPLRNQSQTVVVKQSSVNDIEQIQKLSRQIAPSLVTLTTSVPGSSKALPTRIGTGIILTSDGLVITTANIARSASLMGISSTNEVVKAKAATPTVQDLSFAVAEGRNSSLPFVDPVNLDEGMAVWLASYEALGSGLQLGRATLSSLHAVAPGKSLIEESDTPQRRYGLDRKLSPTWDGAAAITSDGKLIGIVRSGNEQSEIVPIQLIEPFLGSIIKNDKVSKPSLGVSFVDLAYAPTYLTNVRRGALLSGSNAVEKNSPAEKARLFEGDIISAVNGVQLSARYSLSESLISSRPGDNVKYTVIRGEVEQQISATLGSQE